MTWESFGSRSVRSAAVLALALGACNRQARPNEPYKLQPEQIVLMRLDPPPYCRMVGTVKTGKDVDRAYLHLQEQAADLYATHIVLDGTRSESGWGYGSVRSEMFGRAFWCPPPPSAPAAPVAPPLPPATAPAPASMSPDACQPSCAPGYVCRDSACWPDCSPACASGTTCNADRVCRRAAPVVPGDGQGSVPPPATVP